jgi:3,5-epimerase/4-reductase
MKVLTLGTGFVADHLPYRQITERIPYDLAFIQNIIKDYQPDVLVNCIGKTGRPNVDWCESHKEETMAANVTMPLLLADACHRANVHLIQIGSGCIYFGESPYKGHTSYAVDPGWQETDFANPKSFYSKTKYSCDLMLGQLPHVTTLRIRMPVSDKDTSRNLINKLRGYKQVIDIPNSMTLMSDLARCIEWAADKKPGGIFHVANPQPLTAARIMKEFQKYVPEHQFEIITESQLDDMTIAKRSNCILNTDKLQRAGFKMTHSEEALAKCMASYVENMRRTNV